jgi:hypothetical protein
VAARAWASLAAAAGSSRNGLLAERIGIWLDQQLSTKGLSFREASKRLRLTWSGEKHGAALLIQVIGGLKDFAHAR